MQLPDSSTGCVATPDHQLFLKSKRRLVLDFYTPEWPSGLFTELDPRKMVEESKRAHVNAVYFSAKGCCGNSYYNTAVGHKHSALGDRDLLREWIAAAHNAGLKAIGCTAARCSRSNL